MSFNIFLKNLIVAGRPKHWTKNLLVFPAVFFSQEYINGIWLLAIITFICFCFISSSIYFLNDSLDVEEDKKHPIKKNRVIASGKISIRAARFISVFLALSGLLLALLFSIKLNLLLLLYLVLQILYCFILKHIPLLDIFCIAAGFLIRSISVGLASTLFISPWFLLTVGQLSLFLAIEKRKAELLVYKNKNQIPTRKVLKRYSYPLLLRLESLVATSTFICYSLWASGPQLNGASSSKMLITVPFVLAGIFRYQLLSDPEEIKRRYNQSNIITTEKPEEILFNDKGVRIIVLGWIISIIFIRISS